MASPSTTADVALPAPGAASDNYLTHEKGILSWLTWLDSAGRRHLAFLGAHAAGIRRSRDRLPAALLELERQRFDVFHLDLIADFHLREVPDLRAGLDDDLVTLRPLERHFALLGIDRGDRGGDFDSLCRPGDARTLGGHRGTRLRQSRKCAGRCERHHYPDN